MKGVIRIIQQFAPIAIEENEKPFFANHGKTMSKEEHAGIFDHIHSPPLKKLETKIFEPRRSAKWIQLFTEVGALSKQEV